MPDLFALMPPLKRVSHPLLTGQRVTLVGVSAILHDETVYYFEIAKPRYWVQKEDKPLVVGIAGIGGRIEKGEKPLACLRREIQEELGVEFQFELPEQTVLMRQSQWVAVLDLPPSRKHPTPCIVNLMPPRLGGPGQPDHIAIVAFQGRPRQQPRRGDLYGLLTIERSAAREFFQRAEWPLEEALAHPALSFDLQADLPAGCILRPVLTGRAFQTLLGQQSTP